MKAIHSCCQGCFGAGIESVFILGGSPGMMGIEYSVFREACSVLRYIYLHVSRFT
jgi:hypothetical protein